MRKFCKSTYTVGYSYDENTDVWWLSCKLILNDANKLKISLAIIHLNKILYYRYSIRIIIGFKIVNLNNLV